MDRLEFETIVEQTFDRLPARFKDGIENVGVVVEDYPSDEIVRSLHLRSKHDLLGLYQGVPRSVRGSWYGMSPVVPDRITLYQKNIESQCSSDEQIVGKVYEVLIHEIGHYFGMNEDQIRAAGY